MDENLEIIFRYRNPNMKKLKNTGFRREEENFVKKYSICQDQFEIFVIINVKGQVSYKVIEKASEEEYALVHVENAKGKFVQGIRDECEEILKSLSEECFETEVLSAEQTKRILAHVKSEYEVSPEFLWKDSPGYAALRRGDNGKWFGTVMNIGRKKIGLLGAGNIDVINLKADPLKVLELLAEDGFHPAYHMNKKHWFTLRLDGTVMDERIFKLIDESYKLNKKK